MALSQAILASLATVGPCSGYDLVKRFDEYISCYWMASHQQVYKELRELEKKGWISPEAIAQTGRPNKVVYDITPAGQQALIDWTQEPSQPAPIRESLMIKLKAGGLVDASVILQELQRRQQLHQANLERLYQVEATEFANPTALDLPDYWHYLSLRRGIRYETEWVEWCQEAIAGVQHYLQRQNSSQSAAKSTEIQ